jgi:uncharacterized protein
VKLVVLAALQLYRRLLSPLLPPACRYVPSCSEYALEAVERHGAWRGAALTTARVLKCHPLARGGYDPVPGGFDHLHPCAHDADGLAR